MSKNKDYSKFYNKQETPEAKEVINAPTEEKVKEVQATEPTTESVTAELKETEVKEANVEMKKAIVVNATKVNMRKAASKDSEVIATLQQGTKVSVLDEAPNGVWTKITYKDQTGFMMSQFLKEIK